MCLASTIDHLVVLFFREAYDCLANSDTVLMAIGDAPTVEVDDVTEAKPIKICLRTESVSEVLKLVSSVIK